MALSNATKQANYRKRLPNADLVRLQSIVGRDVHEIIGELANQLGVKRYAVIEHSVNNWLGRKASIQAHQDRTSAVILIRR